MQRPFKVAFGKANAPGELVLNDRFAAAPSAEQAAQVRQVLLDFAGLAAVHGRGKKPGQQETTIALGKKQDPPVTKKPLLVTTEKRP